MTSTRILAAVLLFLPAAAAGQAKKAGPRPMETKASPEAKFIATAESAAPAAIGSKAAVVQFIEKGKATMVRPGTNDFTCTVGVPGDANAPICLDRAAARWWQDMLEGKPKPGVNVPGIAHM